MKVPLPQITTESWKERRRPNRSLRKRAIRDPKAAPKTANEVMFALRLARADPPSSMSTVVFVCCMPKWWSPDRAGRDVRLKSFWKDSSPTLALKPPSS